jgi:hypothetical protein
MQILLWVLGGLWFISAVLFVLALAAAAGRRLSMSIKVVTPASNRKRRLTRRNRVPASVDSAASPANAGKDKTPVLTAISQT